MAKGVALVGRVVAPLPPRPPRPPGAPPSSPGTGLHQYNPLLRYTGLYPYKAAPESMGYVPVPMLPQTEIQMAQFQPHSRAADGAGGTAGRCPV